MMTLEERVTALEKSLEEQPDQRLTRHEIEEVMARIKEHKQRFDLEEENKRLREHLGGLRDEIDEILEDSDT